MWSTAAGKALWTRYCHRRSLQKKKKERKKERKKLGEPTIARWKSGLFPFVVLANNVNWETHNISPSMSFTLAFHIFSSLAGSEKTRSERLVGKKVS